MGERGQIVIPKEIRMKEGMTIDSQIKIINVEGEILLQIEKRHQQPEDKILAIL